MIETLIDAMPQTGLVPFVDPEARHRAQEEGTAEGAGGRVRVRKLPGSEAELDLGDGIGAERYAWGTWAWMLIDRGADAGDVAAAANLALDRPGEWVAVTVRAG